MSTGNGKHRPGRFQPGNGGGPGRPSRQAERAYLDATVAGCPLKDWAAIVRKAVADAKKGSATARRWLSDILLGRDPVAVRDLADELREELEALRNGRQR